MQDRTPQNIKLGIFVLLGLASLVTLLYFMGAQKNLFGKQFPVEVVFRNVSGLRVGNNVRMGGINIGTVRKIVLEADTAVRVTLTVDHKLAPLIKTNDVASLGTDGLMGNRVVNIEPGPSGAPSIAPNGILAAREALDMDAMMRTLDITNRNFARMSEDLVQTVQRINNSEALWAVLEDEQLPAHIRATVRNIQSASQKADLLVADIQTVIREVASSEQGIIALMKDSTLMTDLHAASGRLRRVTEQADSLGATLQRAATSLSTDLAEGEGPLNAILRDSSLTRSVQRSLSNVEKGTDAFNQNMEALKSHFLFRGYFRRLEKEARKQAEKKE